MSIVFFGSSKFVIPILEVLRKNFDLKLVLTTERLAFQGQAWEAAVINYCVKHKISYISVSNLSDQKVKSQLLNINCQLAVLADFGLIIPEDILNAFPKGIINIHPSLLPKYRGPIPAQSAILNGEKTTGVTIIKLDEKIDHGPILFQTKAAILPNDTSESLYERLFKMSSSSIVQTIELYLKGKIKPQEQNHNQATFTKPLTRQDGYVDLNELLSRAKLEKMIKAYFPWPGVWTKTELNGVEKIIKLLPNYLKSQYPNDPILIQVEGKKPMSYKDFVNGYPKVGKETLGKLKLS